MADTNTGNTAGGAPPSPSDKLWIADTTRAIVGGVLIIASLFLVYEVLQLAIQYAQDAHDKTKPGPDVATIAAIVGAITTFVGSSVGMYFGAHVAGQVANTANTNANTANANANTAIANAKAATDTSTAATQLAQASANTARVASNAAAQLSNVHVDVGGLKARGKDLFAELRQSRAAHGNLLKSLSAIDLNDQVQTTAAVRQMLAVPPPRGKWATVYDIVMTNLGDVNGDATKNLTDPAGFGLSPGAYQALCDKCTDDVNNQLGCSITLPGYWRDAHQSGTASDFITDLCSLVP